MSSNKDVILQVNKISKEFPGVKALDSVDLTLRKGEIHALVGENGAGKSTLIKILAGIYLKDSGEILFENRHVDFHRVSDSLKLGIKVVFQELTLIPGLSVAENVFLESFPLKKSRMIDWNRLNSKTIEILKSIGLEIDPKLKVSELSVPYQQMVEISRAFSHEKKVVVMDEPTSALTPNEVKFLFNAIRKLKNLGVATLYVTHKLDEIFELCDRVTVLRDGNLISSRMISETNIDEIIKDMVGRTITTLFPKTHSGKGRNILSIKGLSTEKKLKDVTFNVHAGEIVGVFGLLGAGRTELAKAIFGLDPVTSGEIFIEDQRLKHGSTIHSSRAGLGFLTEDRKAEGLILQMSVTQNLTLPSIKEFSSFGFIRGKDEIAHSQKFVNKLSIKTPSLRQKVEYLSGGNQQKILLARWLMKKLKVIIVDEPTRGIDVGAKAEIHKLIDELAKEGLAVLVMISEMPELLGVSDRIIVMSNGRITGEFDKDEATQENILAAAIT